MGSNEGIEIVVIRDPDMETRIALYIDGKHVSDASYREYHVDAGAGYSWDDWLSSRATDIAEASDEVAGVLTEAALDPPGVDYVDDWPEDAAQQLDYAVAIARADLDSTGHLPA